MSAEQPRTDQKDGRVVGYWTSVKQRLECVVNKEVENYVLGWDQREYTYWTL